MNPTNPKADFFFTKYKKWNGEIELLRKIALDCGLTEELKWGCPCYVFEKKNVVLIHVFKEYCALLFFKGALLKDTDNVLIQQTDNVQAARQIRFTNVKEITKIKAVLKSYIFQAIEIEKAGLKVPMKKATEYKVPEELKNKFGKMPELKAAFDKLTPGRQRGYLLHFAQPKQSKTRESRIEKTVQLIMEGKGLTD